MNVSQLMRLVLIAALIGFTVRADAACLSTGAMPTVQHVGACADVVSGEDHKPSPQPDTQKASACAFACLALAEVAEPRVRSRADRPAVFDVGPPVALAGVGERPAIPPPRSAHRNSSIST
jgi:hypothetical protein